MRREPGENQKREATGYRVQQPRVGKTVKTFLNVKHPCSSSEGKETKWEKPGPGLVNYNGDVCALWQSSRASSQKS